MTTEIIVTLFVILTNSAGETFEMTRNLKDVPNPEGRCAHWMSEGAENQVQYYERFDRVLPDTSGKPGKGCSF